MTKTKETTTMATINFNEHIVYIEEDKIKLATLGEMLNNDWNTDDCGLEYVGENENGESLYTGGNFEGKLTIEELNDIETDWYSIQYWDGNNWKTDIFETYSADEAIITRLDNKGNGPEYYFVYELKFEDNYIIEVTQSNMSGSLSPYYTE